MTRPPHLPFLSGPPDFAVGLKPIDHWLDPDTEAHVLPEKRSLAQSRLGEVFAEIDGTGPAQEEAARLIGPATLIEAGLMVSDDLCVMCKAGQVWTLGAAFVCAPSHWRLEDNIGGPLAHLHGPVPDRLGPDGGQGLSARIARLFDGLAPDRILERFNWTIQAGPERFTPSSAPLLRLAEEAAASDAGRLLHLRVERQTIRKLPDTGAVLFTIRVCIDPLADALAQGGARAAFERAWAGAPQHVREYKNWPRYDALVDALLAQTPLR